MYCYYFAFIRFVIGLDDGAAVYVTPIFRLQNFRWFCQMRGNLRMNSFVVGFFVFKYSADNFRLAEPFGCIMQVLWHCHIDYMARVNILAYRMAYTQGTIAVKSHPLHCLQVDWLHANFYMLIEGSIFLYTRRLHKAINRHFIFFHVQNDEFCKSTVLDNEVGLFLKIEQSWNIVQLRPQVGRLHIQRVALLWTVWSLWTVSFCKSNVFKTLKYILIYL